MTRAPPRRHRVVLLLVGIFHRGNTAFSFTRTFPKVTFPRLFQFYLQFCLVFFLSGDTEYFYRSAHAIVEIATTATYVTVCAVCACVERRVLWRKGETKQVFLRGFARVKIDTCLQWSSRAHAWAGRCCWWANLQNRGKIGCETASL